MSLAKTILRLVFARKAMAGDWARLPALYQNAGGGFMSRLAGAGILRLALRWPGLAVILALAMVAARVSSGRSQGPKKAPVA